MAPSRGSASPSKTPLTNSKASAGTRKTSNLPPSSSSSLALATLIPPCLQQRLLDVFTTAFPDLLNTSSTENLSLLLQEIKGHLYNRDFHKAFGNPRYLEAYAVRWSASRALAYLQIFTEMYPHLDVHQPSARKGSSSNRDHTKNCAPLAIKITCLGGGGGAELCALAGFCQLLQSTWSSQILAQPRDLKFDIVAVDNANWANVISTLHVALSSPPSISAYASQAAQAAYNTIISAPGTLSTRFHQHDLLSAPINSSSPDTLLPTPTYSAEDFQSTLHSSHLITLMFTLNELYTASLPSTQTFLLNLTVATTPGTVLLVVDSPGSYSTVTVNRQEKRYPMHWLLEHTLLRVAATAVLPDGRGDVEGRTVSEHDDVDRGVHDVAAKENTKPHTPISTARPESAASSARWEKILSEPSRWFRLPQGLRYPLRLEDMRFQMHVYRRL